MHLTDHYNPSALKPVHCFPCHVRHCISTAPTPTHLPQHAQTLAAETVIVTAMMVVRDTLYIFITYRIDIVEFIRSVSMARLILASSELIGILHRRRKLQSRPKVVVVVKSGPRD